MRLPLFMMVLLSMMSIASVSLARNTVPLIVFGSDAIPDQGDDDFKQVFIFKIPETNTEKMYVRIFDPDCGGAWDELVGKWNTQTKFTFFGGEGVFSKIDHKLLGETGNKEKFGREMVSKVYEQNDFTDNRWFNLAELNPLDGEKIGNFYYVVLWIEGIAGNDGNVFDISLSLDARRNQPPPGVKILNYSPTIQLRGSDGRLAELRFYIPETIGGITIKNFDLEYASAWFETPFESDFPLISSGQGEWKQNEIVLKTYQTGQMGAVMLQSFRGRQNNAIFRVEADTHEPIPFELPVFLYRENQRPIPNVSIEYLSDCQTVVFDGSPSVDKDGDLMTFHWKFGDGLHADGVRTTHRYEKSGRYTCEVIVTDNSGRIASQSRKAFFIDLNDPPTANAGENRVTSPGKRLSFDAGNSTDADGKIRRYVWDFGDRTAAEGVKVSHSYGLPGVYSVNLYVEDDSDSPCNSDNDRIEVWVNAPPVVDVGPDKIASPNETVEFSGSNSFDSDGIIVDYAWDMGDGTVLQGETVQHAYEKPGNYRVVLKITDNAGVENSYATDKLNMVVNDRPIAAPAVNHLRSAINEALTFNAGKSYDPDGHLIGYTWDYGDGATGEGQTTNHAYEKPGTYTVRLRVQDNSTTSSDTDDNTITVIINDPPISNAGEDQHVTAGEVVFDGSASTDPDGTIIAYNWDFGDDRKGEGASPVHVYSSPGTYRVTLTVTDDSGTSTQKDADDMTVIVNAKPIADAGMDQTGKPEEEIGFDGRASLDPDGTISRYFWDFGDGGNAEGPVVTHAYSKPGLYSVTLNVEDDTGHAAAIDYDEAGVKINAQPVAVAGYDVLAAPKQEIVLDASGSYDPDGQIQSWCWRISDGTDPLCAEKIRRSFDEPGIYSATLTVDDGSGTMNAQSMDSLVIHINQSPIADMGEPVHTCDMNLVFDGSASSDADGDVLTYSWDFGDGTPPTRGVSVNHTYRKGGKYPVVLTVDDGTGLDNAISTISKEVTINQAPVANAGKSRTVCAGEMILFDASRSFDPEGGKMKYTWDFGDGNTGDGLNPTKIYKDGGIYQVTLWVQDDSGLSCNKSIDRISIRVAEAPIADAGEDQTVCANTMVQFDGSSSTDFDGVVNGYFWDYGDGVTGGGEKPTHVYDRAGTYRVILTVTGDQIGNCDNTNTDEMLVRVYESPTATYMSKSIAAVGEKVAFDASGSLAYQTAPINTVGLDFDEKENALPEKVSITAYRWDFGDGNTAEGKAVEHVYETYGKYFVKLTVETDSGTECNASSVLRPFVVNAAPVANAGEDRWVAINEPVFFDASASSDADGDIVEYIWDFGDGESAAGVSCRHQFKESGQYDVKLTVKDNTKMRNNRAEDILNVRVNEPPAAAIKTDADVYCVDASIEFDGSESHDPDGEIVSWQWDFGDGAKAEGKSAVHAFSKTGVYFVLLTVDDGQNVMNRLGRKVKKIVINDPPLANAGEDRIVCVGEKTPFSAETAWDRDGKIIEYRWDFGDGLKAEGRDVVHTYTEPGEYEVRLTVTDDSGSLCNTVEDTALVLVNTPPVAEFDEPVDIYSGGAHDAVIFDAGKSSDANGHALTYRWDFGDGTIAVGKKIFHRFPKPGKYKVTLTVDDGAGKPCGQTVKTSIITVNKR